MVDIVISVAAKVAEYLVAPVGRQLGYLFCYNSNLAELHDQVEKLDDKRWSLHRSVNDAEMQGNGIEEAVQKWLKRADGISQEVEKFIEDEKNAKKRCCKGLCPNLVSRYKLSRQAKKKALDVKKSLEGGDFQTISYPLPLPGAGSAPLPEGYKDFESRNLALEQIVELLRSDDVKMIGVWGMGGVGKTTLVKKVARLAKEENLFATEIYIDVSWTREADKIQQGISDIQQQIADMLLLKLEGVAKPVRAGKLMQGLKKEKELKNGKILIILDDIWNEINLEEVGIPSKDDQTICKLVLVSRNEHVLSKGMGTKKLFPIRHLQEEEAWELFRGTAGDSVEGNNELRSIAIEVVKECGGLPIAIVTVANALKDESLDVWNNALHELRTSAPTSIYGVEKKVYACLELSYNHLKDDKVKSLFLLCGCLSYYGDISMDVLLARAMGLDFFDDTELLEQARHKLVALVRTLKASSLLLDGDGDASRAGTSRLLFMNAEDNKSVRMHDLVRDVARNIASKDSHRFVVREDVPLEKWSETDESKFISLHCKVVHELPHRLVCPKLQFFLLQSSSPSLNVPDNFFEGMNRLKVLALSGMHFTTIPSTLQSPANLRTLCLERCKLEDIVVITELKKLQVLSMVGSSIQRLPQEMARLTNLRLLDLHDCRELKVIPRNIVSNMSGLECLFMKSSFSQWAAEENNDGESNACLSELNHLHHLTTIEVEIPNVKLVPEEDKFFQNLTSYAIFIGNFYPWEIHYERSKTLMLRDGDGSLLFRNGMGKLLERIEELELRRLKDNIICNNEKYDSTRSLFSPSMPMSFHNLKYLSIFDCGNVCIPNEDGVLFGEKVSFPNLEEVTLIRLPKLKKIWDHNLSPHPFSNLRILKVWECEALEHVFDYQGYDDTNDEILPKLETLELGSLVELKGIVPNNDSRRGCFSPWMSVSFYNLKCLYINYCGKEDKDQGNADILIQDGVFFGEKVSFPNLEELYLSGLSMLKMIWHPQQYEFPDKLQILRVCNCPRLVNLIPSHLLQRFQNLKEVVVRDCEVLNYVFDDEGILPKIEILKLEELPNLRLIFNNGDKNDNMRYLLSLSKSKVLEHIKELHIVNCGKFMDEEGSFSSNLEVLALGGFSKLKEINFENHRKLKILKLEKLPKLSHIILNEDGNATKRCLLSPSTFKNFDGLNKLYIIDCGMEERRDVYTPTNGIVLSNEKVPLFDEAVCNYEAFKSRAPIFDKIMDALRDDNINSIGVVGIGGVGKTTLIKQVAHQAMQRHLFTKQLYLDLSWTHHTNKLREEEIVKIRQKIAKMLGWEDEEWYWYGSNKGVKLKKRLKQEKMLIILDDIWKEIDLEEIGIPSCKDDDDDVNECKIVLSSRSDGGMLSEDMMMCAQTCFVVETLPPDEALTLFEKTVVAGADSVVKENITELIKECEGVPLAIVTIANALKDETMDVWKNALQHLKNCATMEGKKVVYSCLEWSYTHLKGHHDVKSLLLLCAMLGYDDISMDYLLKYAIGLDLFSPIDSLDQARNRLVELVEILKASSWLIELDHCPEFVRMHDVVYDVVREIASKDPHPFVFTEDVIRLEKWSKSDESKRCAFLSLHCKVVPELPQQLVAPQLQCFLLHNNNPSLNIPIPNTFFQGMKKLQVLDLSDMGFTTVPSSLYSLENLRTLCLDQCHKLEDIAFIGKLTKLQVLSLVGSTIRKLPDEMEQLTNLRLLNLDDCEELEVIPHNVLSILSRLECLCIRLPDAKFLPKDIQFENLTRYAISIGFWWGSRKTHRTLTFKKVNISLELGDGILKLLERSEELEFKELSGTNYVLQYPLGGESFVKLKHLKVSKSPEIKYIIDSKDQRVLEHDATFPLLESLVLSWMENLQEVWHGHPIPRGSFGNLKTLKVKYCHKLRYLFSFSTTRGLSQLQNMTIKRCKAMEQIITYERELEDEYDEGGTNLELFPNLRTLKLKDLPQLINFIPKLETNARPEDSSFNHKVSFSKLEELELLEVPKLKDVWNPQRPFGSFSNLRNIKWEA